MSEYFDELETRAPELREREQFAALRTQIVHAKARAPAFAERLAGIEPADIANRAALAQLPVMRKSALVDMQRDNAPFGGLATIGWGDARLVFASPGPIYEPQGASADYWRLARALHAAGFRRGDLVHNCFSYHLTPGGAMLESGAHALGCTVFRGGVGQTEQQLQAMVQLKPRGYVGTPSFLKIILDKADEVGSTPSFEKALVSGEAFMPSQRQAFEARGIASCQVYASADLGSIAYESSAGEGLIVDEGILLELVRPGTGDLVGPGEVGEVVVTLLYNRDYPLIRFGTGDLSALLPGVSPCGRSNLRIKGWLGRADQTTKVKGMFVHPLQIADIARRHPEIAKARLVVDHAEGGDRMTLHIELHKAATADGDAIKATMREVTTLRGDVVVESAGQLANDGKVIDDTRKHS